VSVLAKYRYVFLTGLQSSLVYRWNFAARSAFSLVHLSFVFILWGAAYRGQTDIGGFNLAQTLTYFLAMLVIQFFISAQNEDYQIGEDIRNGMINQFLLKPINYYAYRLTLFFSARLVTGALALLPILLAYPLFSDTLSLPSDPWRLLYGAPALLLSALIQFSIAYIFGLLAFWFLEIQSFIILSLAVETVLGGQMFPLDLLPGWAFRLSQFLPYYYQMYFPTAILTGRLDQTQAAEGLVVQLVWLGILFGIGRLLWTRGLRRHTAVGG
jgi:ABC-2 type transport system permease protein